MFRSISLTNLVKCTLYKGHYLFILAATCVIVFVAPPFLSPQKYKLTAPCYHDCFTQALQHHASADRVILLALVDTAFVDMALNLYYTSLLPHNINNFLFVGAGEEACQVLYKESIPCFLFTTDQDSNQASRYNSNSFNRKMNIRTDMIILALREGFTVVHSDLDMVFLQNPMPELKLVIESADIATMQDSSSYNAGFLIIKPSIFGKEIYKRVKQITDQSLNIDDQTALNNVIGDIHKKNSSHGFKVTKLHNVRYACGLIYFEHLSHYFPEDKSCPNCTVVHNNWIVGKEAKTYRFKEMHMWMVDRDQYYTNPTQRYLVYDNPIDNWETDGNATIAELNALKAALAIGQMTRRVVILPRFHCGPAHTGGSAISLSKMSNPRKLYKFDIGAELNFNNKSQNVNGTRRMRECPLNALLDVTAFDKELSGLYRESSFLTHPLVNIPASLYSQPQLILSPSARNIIFKHSLRPRNSTNNATSSAWPDNVQTFQAPAVTGDASFISEQAILEKYDSKVMDKLTVNQMNARVLVFHSLYGVTPVFTDKKINEEYEKKIKRAFRGLGYRQLGAGHELKL